MHDCLWAQAGQRQPKLWSLGHRNYIGVYIGIMEKNMENYHGIMGYILGFYRDNGK